MASPNNFTFYGFPDECRNFDERHPLWNEMMGNLVRALNLAFTRVEVMKGSADKFVYFFGRIILEDFMIPVCDHPGSKMRLNHTWNKLDFVAMAKKAGEIGKLIVPGYYFPLRDAHPTFGGLTERLEIVNEQMSLKGNAQPEIADRSLMTAHNCILDALKVQSEHFKIEGLEDAIQVFYCDFVRVWSPHSPLLKD